MLMVTNAGSLQSSPFRTNRTAVPFSYPTIRDAYLKLGAITTAFADPIRFFTPSHFGLVK